MKMAGRGGNGVNNGAAGQGIIATTHDPEMAWHAMPSWGLPWQTPTDVVCRGTPYRRRCGGIIGGRMMSLPA
jgi:hypothetical protein